MPEMALNCPHCSTVKAGFRSAGSHRRGEPESDLWDVLFYCRVCLRGVVIVLSDGGYGRDPVQANEDSFVSRFTLTAVYPAPIELATPEHVPDVVARDYIEALDSLRRGNFNAAGVMFRKVLQRATTAVAKDAGLEPFSKRTPLQHRIDALANGGLLTGSMCKLAATIKLDGNTAAHEEDQDFDRPAATRMQEFTELFLTYTFTLPERVRLAEPHREEVNEGTG